MAAARPAPGAASPVLAGRPTTVAFVGAGRVAGALAVAMAGAGHGVVAICSRDPVDASDLARRVGARGVPTALAAIRSADITLLTVPDAAITGVAAAVAATGAALRGHGVVHCSASLGIEALAALRLTGASVGCLHPLQALAGAESAALLRGSLVAIDADPALRAPLERLTLDLGGRPVVLDPGSRPLYHAAAVLAGNAPLALLAAAAELLEATGLDPRTAEEGLIALMAGALANVRRLGPRDALTGPVVRGDTATVASHLAALRDHPDADALYRVMTREILRLAGAAGAASEAGAAEIARLLDRPDPLMDRAPAGRTPRASTSASGHRRRDVGVRVDRRLGGGADCSRAEPRAPSASQGARTPGPAGDTTPTSLPGAEESTCP
jgi:predicted short-subunit dehydrogenase-like oxidoreductase (DUF2520 family)